MATYIGPVFPDGPQDIGFPFVPFFVGEHNSWRLWCPNLTREGRCGDYENRPRLCRSFQAGSDPLCIMHGMIEPPAAPALNSPR